MYKGELLDVMDAALTVLHETKNELNALREQALAIEEHDDAEDCVVEAPFGDSGRTLSLCA